MEETKNIRNRGAAARTVSEPKRTRPRLLETSSPEIVHNKKRLVENVNRRMSTGILSSSSSMISIYDSPSQPTSVPGLQGSIVPLPATGNPFTSTAPNLLQQKPVQRTNENYFFSTVKSIFVTGIFDGVPVKYFSFCRQKSLRGMIQGDSFLCGCKNCKGRRAQTALEFERHAGARSHNAKYHIHFENGKTVYGVFQELRNTPHSELVDAIQNVTGSPVNEVKFQIWKDKFEAALKALKQFSSSQYR